MIDEQRARAIAAQDAEGVYGDVSMYEVSARLDRGHWHVDYELADKTLLGGGPHYVIAADTGEIVSFRYEQ